MPPKNVDDWHDRLILALQARYAEAIRGNQRSQNTLAEAIRLLEKSKSPVYIQKGGQNKGNVVGIPKKITGHVLQLLIKIVNEEEEVLLPHHQGVNTVVRPADEHVVTNRRYRDSAFAILAALWVDYSGPMGSTIHTQHLQRKAQKYCDADMTFNPRNRQQGAWKAKDPLVQRGYIFKQSRLGSNFYSLTLSGAKVCYAIFHDKFHPSKGNYELIEPRQGRADADGNFYATGQAQASHDDVFALRFSPNDMRGTCKLPQLI